MDIRTDFPLLNTTDHNSDARDALATLDPTAPAQIKYFLHKAHVVRSLAFYDGLKRSFRFPFRIAGKRRNQRTTGTKSSA